ncbi:hypothetical protein AJ85_20410 [Alkalihalobacillus alcalophilus ATCC 27647 = CGMCC 1.3604]|uniref:DUF4305 domain-containing protein n=1 Tax=Alkalihalobacillus alcalophilus ATCC 27647 = CGMCC 1.3604 TaxID=1218173 RepID=A0A094WLT7_ALKAL|nr:YdiK family protein [Alkalihalobacillus alcalophilus]KGA97791.1 hypothetical protein BALCAV_0208145 [Alkalihalobacillus alcalophilus ATCC 27647 = CGMCC 1.3604]MED1562050.1 YdiK family protein [Alkalihalobacillus alcalophilus]THG88942.1 hypothetical protein AJ85_20410 [Alkalihalobacillus alcalophilus ATCC 27647 = CGMCC 1.3604]
MRFSPLTISIIYFSMGTLFIMLAIRSVNMSGWDVWTILLMGFAAFDYFLAIRYFQLRKIIKKMQQSNNENDNK